MTLSTLSLPYRQVHLDFHTSPDIPGVGADFDPDEFADTLARAHVSSVTCFARCHHGMIYYQSKAHPERIHPHLVRPNLLAEQIEACHKRGIRVPIYTTVEWDEYTADRHRDWLCIDEEGREVGTRPLEAGFYRFLDVFHPGYRQFLKDHIADIFASVPVDGLFLDICIPMPSLALHWIEAMDAADLNPEDANHRQRFARRVMDEFMLEMSAFIRSQPGYSPDCTIFFNSGHIGPRHRSSTDAFTHYELESLPSGGWGYLHFPAAQRFARGLGKPTLGMTGKFHTSWGDFHSYKNPAALEFEVRQMLALGARCSIGDQLHPRGRLDEVTYRLIGQAYADVHEREPWCEGSVPVVEAAILTPEEADLRDVGGGLGDRVPPSTFGALRMLQELGIQFDIITTDRDFSQYRVLLLPDAVRLNEELQAKLGGYVEAGGSAIMSCEALLTEYGSPAGADWLPATDAGPAPFEPDFLRPGEILRNVSQRLKDVGYVMYTRGRKVTPADGAAVLAQVEAPYFNRTWRHFCSHRHAPSSGEVVYPGVVQKGTVVYLAHPVFTLYYQQAPLWCRDILDAVLRVLMPGRLVEVDGPSGLLTALTEQPQHARRVLHLLYYVPERRGQAFDTIEDIVPLYNVTCRVQAPGIGSVRVVPEGEPLSFSLEGGRAVFTLPVIRGHAMVELA